MISGIYVRVSTNQQNEGTSLDTQEQRCLEAATAMGGTVSPRHIWRETASASDTNRPLLVDMRRCVREREIEALFIYDTDRLSRNPIDLLTLVTEAQTFGVDVRFVQGGADTSPQGQLILYVRGYASQQERLHMRERTMRGKAAIAARGRMPIGDGWGLYGYRYDPATKSRYIIEEEAVIIRRIFREIASGDTMYAVCCRLTAEGVPTKHNCGVWHVTTLRQILSRTAYFGVDVYGKQRIQTVGGRKHIEDQPRDSWIIIEGYSPPIITKAEFDAAHRQLEMRQPVRRTNRVNFLTGITRCGQCGSAIVKTAPDYYRCRRTQKSRLSAPTCFEGHLPKEALENLVWNAFSDMVLHPDLLRQQVQSAMEPVNNDIPDQILQAKRNLASTEKKQLDLLELQEDLAESVFRKRLRMLAGLHRQQLEVVAQLEQMQQQTIDISTLEDRIVEQCAEFRERVHSMDAHEKQQALRLFGVTVTATREAVDVSLECSPENMMSLASSTG